MPKFIHKPAFNAGRHFRPCRHEKCPVPSPCGPSERNCVGDNPHQAWTRTKPYRHDLCPMTSHLSLSFTLNFSHSRPQSLWTRIWQIKAHIEDRKSHHHVGSTSPESCSASADKTERSGPTAGPSQCTLHVEEYSMCDHAFCHRTFLTVEFKLHLFLCPSLSSLFRPI